VLANWREPSWIGGLRRWGRDQSPQVPPPNPYLLPSSLLFRGTKSEKTQSEGLERVGYAECTVGGTLGPLPETTGLGRVYARL
jgi:hypothetical protein